MAEPSDLPRNDPLLTPGWTDQSATKENFEVFFNDQTTISRLAFIAITRIYRPNLRHLNRRPHSRNAIASNFCSESTKSEFPLLGVTSGCVDRTGGLTAFSSR